MLNFRLPGVQLLREVWFSLVAGIHAKLRAADPNIATITPVMDIVKYTPNSRNPRQNSAFLGRRKVCKPTKAPFWGKTI